MFLAPFRSMICRFTTSWAIRKIILTFVHNSLKKGQIRPRRLQWCSSEFDDTGVFTVFEELRQIPFPLFTNGRAIVEHDLDLPAFHSRSLLSVDMAPSHITNK